MNIADLFVRVRGDTSDVTRQLKGVEGSMLGVERASLRLDSGMQKAHFSSGRLRQELVSLVRQTTGTTPVIAQLGNVVGEFALGGPLALAATGGIAAIAVGINKLTSASDEAIKKGQQLVEQYLKIARIRALGVGGQQKADIEDLGKANAALVERQGFFNRAASLFGGSEGEAAIGNLFGFFAGRAGNQITQNAKATQAAVNELGLAIAAANDAAVPKIKATTTAMKGLDDTSKKVVITLDELVNKIAPAFLSFPAFIRSLDKTVGDQLNQIQFGNLIPSNIEMPKISKPFEDLTDSQRDQLRKLGVIADNTGELMDVVRSSAIQGAQIIVNALNLGGGGKGSGLGGALGSTAGFAIGFATGGPIGGAIGSLVGQIGGSLLGGLFDHHKKAVNANTQALNANTAIMAQLLNAPEGFKIAQARYNATDVRDLGKATREYVTRGGANPLLVGSTI